MPKSSFDLGIKPIKIKPLKLGFGKASSREPLPAEIKRSVKECAKNTCEYRGCGHKSNLQFHHKNMKNSDNRLSNIELLCPNHHAKRHDQKRRKVVSENIFTGEKKTRLVKKTKKTTKKKLLNENLQNLLG